MTESAGILSGIKVLDVASFVFGPAAATVMSDFGAEVIKIEHPATGDPYRHLHLVPPMPACDQDYCTLMDGRNKRSVALDLGKEEGRQVLYRLVAEADVFLTNYHPSVLEKLRLTYATLQPMNERLIYAQASGYGERGEEVEKPGFDSTAWWARSGLMDAVRQPGADPALSMPAMGDRPSSMSLFGGIMLGLYERQKTGRGCKISSSLMANGAWANACLIQAAFCNAEPLVLPPRHQPPNAVVNLYPTRDGRWINLVMIQEERDWRPLTEAIGRPELGEDPRFATLEARRAHAPELFALLDGAFRERDLHEWRRRLDEHDVTYGVVALTEEAGNDPQMVANGLFLDIDDGNGGTLRTVDSPIWIEGREKAAPRRAATAGEHTEEVLSAAGYAAEEIEELRAAGVIPPSSVCR